MATVKRLASYACTALIVLLFGASGTMKLTPALNSQIHSEIKGDFHRYATIPPVSLLKLEADVYRAAVAILELLCVACILCPKSSIQFYGSLTLLVIMVGAIFTHMAVNDPPVKLIPAVLAAGLVLSRLLLVGSLQVKVKKH